MHQYLEAVSAGQMPVNRDIVALMQDIFNLLPNLNIQRLSQALTGAPPPGACAIVLKTLCTFVVVPRSCECMRPCWFPVAPHRRLKVLCASARW